MRFFWVLFAFSGILLLGMSDSAFAETFTSVSSGSWFSAGTWEDEGGNPGVPGVDDDKTISVGDTVTIPSSVSNSGYEYRNPFSLTFIK